MSEILPIVECPNIMREMESLCVMKRIDRAVAVTALRALCKYYGGQQIFLPKVKREGSVTGDTVRGVIDDAVGDCDGDKICDVIMSAFGGVQVYIPFEVRAFRSEVAAELKERYDGTQDTMRDLCREYNISFSQFYRLWHLAEKERLQPTLFDF